MTEQTSKVISALRFPLALLVITCHSSFLGQTHGSGTSMQLFFCEVLPHVAVPLFMLFSGMLYFRNGMPDTAKYGKQLLKKTRTLLLPYLLWSTIAFVVMAWRGEISPTFVHWLQGLWDTELWNNGGQFARDLPGYPVNMPLWFIRDLMVLMVLSLPIGWMLKATRGWLLLLIAIWWFPGHAKFFGFGADVLFYFSAGAWISLKDVDIISALRKIRIPSYAVAVIMIVVESAITFHLYGINHEVGFCWIPFNLFVVSMMLATLNLATDIVDTGKGQRLRSLSDTSFFLYASHYVLLPFLQKSLLHLAGPHSAAGEILFFWIFLFGHVTILLIIFAVMKKYTPRTLSLLTGGRF